MPRLHKEIILGAAIILLAVFCWYFLKYAFYVGNLSLGCWIIGIILFLLWNIVLCLATLLIKNKLILFSSFVVSLILFFIFFHNEFLYCFIALIILLLCFWFASNRIKKEEEVQVSLNFWRIWKRGLPIFITALCLLISVAYYFSPGTLEIKEAKIKIPRESFNSTIKPLENFIEKRFPQGVSLDSPANKLITPEQRSDLEKQFGIKITTNDKIRDVLYKIVDYQLNTATTPYRKFVPLGLAIILFITLRIAAIIYIPFLILFSYLVLKLLIAIKFIRIEIEKKEVESVKL